MEPSCCHGTVLDLVVPVLQTLYDEGSFRKVVSGIEHVCEPGCGVSGSRLSHLCNRSKKYINWYTEVAKSAPKWATGAKWNSGL